MLSDSRLGNDKGDIEVVTANSTDDDVRGESKQHIFSDSIASLLTLCVNSCSL